MKLAPYRLQKSVRKGNKDLNVRPKTMKLLEEFQCPENHRFGINTDLFSVVFGFFHFLIFLFFGVFFW
jgi:hypothetical protein